MHKHLQAYANSTEYHGHRMHKNTYFKSFMSLYEMKYFIGIPKTRIAMSKIISLGGPMQLNNSNTNDITKIMHQKFEKVRLNCNMIESSKQIIDYIRNHVVCPFWIKQWLARHETVSGL